MYVPTYRDGQLTVIRLGGEAISGSSWQLPESIWELLEPGEEIHWKVRRLPDRAAGEQVADTPESAPRVFVRAD